MTELVTVWNGREGWVGIGGEGYLNVEPERRQISTLPDNRWLWRRPVPAPGRPMLDEAVLAVVTKDWMSIREVAGLVQANESTVTKWLNHWWAVGLVEREMRKGAHPGCRTKHLRLYYRRAAA